MPLDRLRAWRTVEAAEDPNEFVRYLQVVSEYPEGCELSRARLAGAGIKPGSIVLDLGCGIGSHALMLAELVGPSGKTYAVDRSRTMVETTARRARAQGVEISCHEADAASLPFADRSFDAVWIERVLLHVPSPANVFAEIFRVLRDDGQLLAMEPDFAALMITDGGDPELARSLAQAWAGGLANPRIGRSLGRLARKAGFERTKLDFSIRPVRDLRLASAGLRWRNELDALVDSRQIAGERASAWWRNIEAEAEEIQLIAAIPMFTLFAFK